MKGQNRAAKTREAYIAALAEPRRSEIAEIDAFIRKAVPKLKPFMLIGMLGYGPVHYKYASGREGDWAKIALASNASYISLYVCGANEKGAFAEQYAKALGKVSCGKGCILFKSFAGVNQDVLKKLFKEAEAWSYPVRSSERA